MAKKIKYKRPRKINPVSVSWALAIFSLIYVFVKGFNIFMLRMETERVIKSYAVKFNSTRGRWLQNPKRLEILSGKFRNDLLNMGIENPKTTEHWIDITDPDEVLIGVYYIQHLSYPFGIIEDTTFEIQQEVRCKKPNGSVCVEVF